MIPESGVSTAIQAVSTGDRTHCRPVVGAPEADMAGLLRRGFRGKALQLDGSLRSIRPAARGVTPVTLRRPLGDVAREIQDALRRRAVGARAGELGTAAAGA